MLVHKQQRVLDKRLLYGEIGIHGVANLGAKLLVHTRAAIRPSIPLEIIKLDMIRYLGGS